MYNALERSTPTTRSAQWDSWLLEAQGFGYRLVFEFSKKKKKYLKLGKA